MGLVLLILTKLVEKCFVKKSNFIAKLLHLSSFLCNHAFTSNKFMSPYNLNTKLKLSPPLYIY